MPANDSTHAPDGSPLSPLEQQLVADFYATLAERAQEAAAGASPVDDAGGSLSRS